MSMGSEGKEHEIDQWLDRALVRRASVEPRSGLENRVLATLEAESQRRWATRRRWWWVLGTAAVAATVVAGMWFGLAERRPGPSPARVNSMAQEHNIAVPSQAGPRRIAQSPPARVQLVRRVAKSAAPTRASVPKLDQFPSPEPLTDQEKMLARYVQEFPERAVLVARAQTQLRKEEERERLGMSPRAADPATSDQTE